MPEQNSNSPAGESGSPTDLPLSSDAPESSPETRGSLWRGHREELRVALASQSALCGQLYRETVEALWVSEIDTGRLVVAAHAIRELVNLLPSILGDVQLPKRIPDAHLRDQLVDGWNEHLAKIAEGAAMPGMVPGAVTKAINAWVEAQQRIAKNSQARRAALVLGKTEGVEDSSVRVVISAIGVFERLRHPTASVSESRADHSAYQGAFSIIENAITSRILGFFTVKQQLQGVVDAANLQTVTGAWSTPAESEVAVTLARIGGLQHRRIFYDQLGNPEWIEPLDRLHALDAPRSLAQDAEPRWQPWPAGDYLVRMAEHRPAQVREVLLRLVHPAAAQPAPVRLLEAALRMPVSESRKMVSAIRSSLSEELEPHLARDVVTFIEQLAEAGEMKPAMQVAQTLLRPRAAQSGNAAGRQDVRAGIDAYWYKKALTRVITALRADPRILGTVYAWLREEQAISSPWEPDKSWDASVIWRPSIAQHEQNYRHHDIADSLVDALRDLAITQLQSGFDIEPVLKTLERDRMPIAQRIAASVLSSVVSLRDDALPFASERVLDRNLLGCNWLLREYTHLAAATLPRLDDEAYGRWEKLVDDGPSVSDASRQRIVEHLKDDQTEDEAFDEYVRMRRHELLSAIGAGSLRGRLLEMHMALVEDFGEYENAGFQSWHSSSTSEQPPNVADSLSGMSVEDVLATLRSWEPDESRPGTKRGLAEVLSEVAESRPAEFSDHTQSFVQLEEPYRSRFLDGLRKAAESGANVLNWPAFFQGVKELHDGEDEEGYDSTYPQRQVCNTIERAVGGKTSSFHEPLLMDAAEIVTQWIDAPSPSDEDSGMGDHLTESLNTLRPVVVRTLIRIGRAAKLAHSEEFDSAPVIGAVQKALGGRLDPRDGNLAVAAAFGEGLSLMMWIDTDWAASWLDRATTSDAWGDIFVTTALTTNATSTPLLSDLWPSLDAMLDRTAAGEAIESGWRSDESIDKVIGDHLMNLAMWGSPAPWPERIESYFARVDGATAAAVLGHVGWRLMNTAEPAPEFIKRAQALWDARQAAVDLGAEDAGELAEFYWWVHSNVFPVDWWLPRLVRVADQIDFEGRSFIGEHIEES